MRLFIGVSVIFLSLLCPVVCEAQCYTLELQEEYEIAHPFPHQCMTVIHDNQDREYLYTAAIKDGVRIFSIDGEASIEINGIETYDMEGLSVMSLSQTGDFLYVALGDHFSNDQNSGLAIIDVTDPENAFVTDVWKNAPSTGGAGIVKVDGDYAFLGAMQHGLIIFDISNKSNISEVSRIVPDINFPDANPDPDKYNARGVDVKDDEVYLCYDAGGIRIIDVSDISNPVQSGEYSLPALDGLPRAYNNCVVNGDRLYVAIDYCGMEILDVSDAANITQMSWWNDWACETSSNNWFNSPGHTNEMAYIADCQVIGMSAGKSELVCIDVSDPESPFLCTSFGNLSNSEGTWGISAYKNTFYLGYIYVPLGIPFYSNYGGVKAVSINHTCATGIDETVDSSPENAVNIVYNSGLNRVLVQSNERLIGKAVLTISEVSGKVIQRFTTDVAGSKLISVPVVDVPTNIYMISLSIDGSSHNSMVYIQR
jgi:hypothetical protein